MTYTQINRQRKILFLNQRDLDEGYFILFLTLLMCFLLSNTSYKKNMPILVEFNN